MTEPPSESDYVLYLSEVNLNPMLPYFMCRFSFHYCGCSVFSLQSNSIGGKEPSETD